MDGETRRSCITELLQQTQEPLSGTALAKELGVSRQVIVQDIALLRATNKNILSTNKGYILFGREGEPSTCKRVIRVQHTDRHTQAELYAIVDAGAHVLDVVVEHEVYGQISVDLYLKSRKDVDEFMEKIEKSTAKPLKILTEDVHFHTIEATSEEVLDEVERELKQRQYLISE